MKYTYNNFIDRFEDGARYSYPRFKCKRKLIRMFYKYIILFINTVYHNDSPLDIYPNSPNGMTYDSSSDCFESLYSTEIKGYAFHSNSKFFKKDMFYVRLTYTKDHKIFDRLEVGTLKASICLDTSNKKFKNITYKILHKVYKYVLKHKDIYCWLYLNGVDIESFRYKKP